MLSIVVPVHNGAAHIRECMQMLRAQTDPLFEVLVVDDGSTDRSAELSVREGREAGLRQLTLIRQERKGVSVARNVGLREVAGDWVMFLDVDDRIHPSLVRRVSEATASATDMVAWGWNIERAETGRLEQDYFAIHPPVPEHMKGLEGLYRRVVDRTFRTWTSSVAYRRAFLEEKDLRFPEDLAVGEDLEFSYRTLVAADSVRFIPAVLSTYVKREGSTTSLPTIERLDSVRALGRVQQLLDSDPREEMASIASAFGGSKILVNFFYTLETVLRSSPPGAGTLLSEVKTRFPGLCEEVQTGVTARWRGGRWVPFEWRVFAVSSTVWITMVRARLKIGLLLPAKIRRSAVEISRVRSTKLGL